MKVMQLLDDLDVKARRHGGRVISLLGNHEIYNCIGHMKYVSPESLASWGYVEEARVRDFRPGGVQACRLAATRAAYVIVGSYLFTHAGFTSSSMHKLGITSRASLDALNRKAQDWLYGTHQYRDDEEEEEEEEKEKEDAEEHKRQTKKKKKKKKKKTKMDEDGNEIERLLSERVLGTLPSDGFLDQETPTADADPVAKLSKRCRSVLGEVLTTLGLKGIVIGHTIQEDGIITSGCRGRVFRVDFGGSRAFDEFRDEPGTRPPPQVLEIIDDAVIRRLVGVSKKKK